jgi:hypothetical protein
VISCNYILFIHHWTFPSISHFHDTVSLGRRKVTQLFDRDDVSRWGDHRGKIGFQSPSRQSRSFRVPMLPSEANETCVSVITMWCLPNDLCPDGSVYSWKRNQNKFVYYESIKWELQTRPIYECRYDENLKTKSVESTRLSYTGLIGELEHRKIETRLIDEMLSSVMCEYVFLKW